MGNNIQFYIPFEGFYCSIYDSIIDDVINRDIDEGYITETQSEAINYTKIVEALSEHIFDVIIEMIIDEYDLNIDAYNIIYDGLHSPKYYNYSTDKIKAKISHKDYLKIYNKALIDEYFVSYVNEASASRSGFHSFYEGIDEVASEPAIFLEYFFKYFTLYEYRDEVIYKTCDDIHEIIYSNIGYDE